MPIPLAEDAQKVARRPVTFSCRVFLFWGVNFRFNYIYIYIYV